MSEERIISPQPEVTDQEQSLRPKTLQEYIGQAELKKKLHVYLTAAKQRKESVEHLLFYGPPGLGKTTLANIIASEMGVFIKISSGPAIERPGDLAAILTNLQPGDVFFIDEIHRLNRSVEEVLYSAMEDFELDIVIGKGPSAKAIRLTLPKFTLVGATTQAGSLSAPLRDRFGVVERLNFYNGEELKKIVVRSASILNSQLDDACAQLIASRSRGTPRIANRLLRRVRDFAQVHNHAQIDLKLTRETLQQLGIDDLGLDSTDRQILKLLIEKFKGGPVGLDTVAAAISEDAQTLEEVYEPYLLQLGFLDRTPRGRMVTALAYKHLGLIPPVVAATNVQAGLF
jgi:Holliday junction DNA helicase RuvB